MLILETMSLPRMLIKDPLTPPTATQLTTAKQTTANHPPLPPQLQWERLRTILSTLATMMGFMATADMRSSEERSHAQEKALTRRRLDGETP